MADTRKTFDALDVSSKFAICGLPIRVDTYKTCSFGCRYCLRPAHNGRYVPQIAYRKPSEDAVLLTPIGKYPTTITGICFDAYGNGHLFEREVSCEVELLYQLFSCGDCQCPITKLWSLDIDKEYSDEMDDLFDHAYQGRGLEIRGEPVTLEELQLLSMCEDDSPFPESDTNT